MFVIYEYSPLISLSLTCVQAFRKLSNGLETLSEVADTFNSKEVSGLLRSAPSLIPNIKHVENMFTQTEGSKS